MFSVRQFNEGDTKRVIDIVTSSLKELFNCETEDLGKDLIKDLSNIAKNYTEKGGNFFVGEYNGRVIGTVAIIPNTKTIARLKRMFLYKQYRGKGFGSKLYGTAEEWCRKQGYKKITLSTYPNFKKAIKTYKSKGFKKFKKDKERIFFYKNL